MTCTLKLDWSEDRIAAVRLALKTACKYSMIRPDKADEVRAALDDIDLYRDAAAAAAAGTELRTVQVLDPVTGHVLFRGYVHASNAPHAGWMRVQPYGVIDLPPSYKIVAEEG